MALETLRAQVAEDEAVLERGVLVAAPVQTASPQLAAGCRPGRHIMELLLPRSVVLFFLCRSGSCIYVRIRFANGFAIESQPHRLATGLGFGLRSIIS